MNNDSLIDQTLLVNTLLEKNIFTSYDLENSIRFFKSLRHRQWLNVCRALSRQLVIAGETVLINKYGQWWWRLNHDNPLETDPVLAKLRNAEGIVNHV